MCIHSFIKKTIKKRHASDVSQMVKLAVENHIDHFSKFKYKEAGVFVWKTKIIKKYYCELNECPNDRIQFAHLLDAEIWRHSSKTEKTPVQIGKFFKNDKKNMCWL